MNHAYPTILKSHDCRLRPFNRPERPQKFSEEKIGINTLQTWCKLGMYGGSVKEKCKFALSTRVEDMS